MNIESIDDFKSRFLIVVDNKIHVNETYKILVSDDGNMTSLSLLYDVPGYKPIIR